MKLSLSRFLTEMASGKPNISPIRNNLSHCIKHNRFIYRGSETTSNNFGEKDKRESRASLVNSNIIMNFTSAYFNNLPDRKKSYFGTNSPSNASDFGTLFVIIPHDDVKEFAVVSNDFNLRDNHVFDEIKTGLDFAGFGYPFTVSIQNICRKLKQKGSSLSDETLSNLESSITKISTEHKEISKEDFEKFDSLFSEVFSSGDAHRIADTMEDKFATFVWDVVISNYDGSFIQFLKHAVKVGTKDINVVSFEEALKILDSDDTFEIWFEGRCSYFSIDWLNKQYQKINDDEDLDIVYDANDEEDINLAVSEVFSKFI